MWQLISTWQRTDGSVTSMYNRAEPPPIRWMRSLRVRSAYARTERERRRRRLEGSTVGNQVITALGPTIERHGVTAASPQLDDSVVWCSAASDVQLIERPGDGIDADEHDPGRCVDLWVHVDQAARTVAVDFEGNGLAEFVTGRRHFDGPLEVELADSLDDALAILATHVDRLCDAVIVDG